MYIRKFNYKEKEKFRIIAKMNDMNLYVTDDDSLNAIFVLTIQTGQMKIFLEVNEPVRIRKNIFEFLILTSPSQEVKTFFCKFCRTLKNVHVPIG